MARGTTRRVMTAGSVIARRPQADEAIPTCDEGDCFATLAVTLSGFSNNIFEDRQSYRGLPTLEQAGKA